MEELGKAELVVVDTNKFKIKLGIGEDAYTTQKLKNLFDTVMDAKEAVGVGSAGAATVSTLIPAASTGLLTKAAVAVGLASAPATAPLALAVIATAGVLSGGAYFGAKRMLLGAGSSNVETIPKFINTPIDLLGAALFDMIAGLAMKVAEFSAPIDDAERETVVNYFFEEWGIAPGYARRALPLIELQIKKQSLKEMARTLAEFQIDNPDCNPDAIRKNICQFLDELAHADGEFDEKEALAIEAVEREFATTLSPQSQLMRKAGRYSSQVAGVAQGGASAVTSGAKSAITTLRSRLFGKREG